MPRAGAARVGGRDQAWEPHAAWCLEAVSQECLRGEGQAVELVLEPWGLHAPGGGVRRQRGKAAGRAGAQGSLVSGQPRPADGGR